MLVIDEMGHDRLELQVVKEAHLLFKVIDKRYNENKPLIFTSNVEQELWPEFLGDPITTSASLDRIFHHSVLVEITEEQEDWFDRLTTFNINARYDSYKQEFYRLCTKEFAEEWKLVIETLREWLRKQL